MVDPSDERQLFSRAELVIALTKIMSEAEAVSVAENLLAPEKTEEGINFRQWSEATLELLSLVSDNCAKRVQQILHLSAKELEELRLRAQRKFGD